MSWFDIWSFFSRYSWYWSMGLNPKIMSSFSSWRCAIAARVYLISLHFCSRRSTRLMTMLSVSSMSLMFESLPSVV